MTPEPGQRDTPTDLLGAVKVTGGVGDLRYGLLAAMEDDIRWRGRDANDLAVDIEGAGRDFAVAVYQLQVRFEITRTGAVVSINTMNHCVILGAAHKCAHIT